MERAVQNHEQQELTLVLFYEYAVMALYCIFITNIQMIHFMPLLKSVAENAPHCTYKVVGKEGIKCIVRTIDRVRTESIVRTPDPVFALRVRDLIGVLKRKAK